MFEFLIYLLDGITACQGESILIDESGSGAAAIIYDEQNGEVVDVVVMLEANGFTLEHREVR